MVIRTFCQPEASEPVDTQRLTSSSAPFVNQRQASPLTRRDLRRLLHILSSRDGESDDMRGYLMVIRTFLLILTHEVRWQAEIPKWLSVQRQLLLILTREVRWHVGVPYGYPHLLLTRGKRAR